MFFLRVSSLIIKFSDSSSTACSRCLTPSASRCVRRRSWSAVRISRRTVSCMSWKKKKIYIERLYIRGKKYPTTNLFIHYVCIAHQVLFCMPRLNGQYFHNFTECKSPLFQNILISIRTC